MGHAKPAEPDQLFAAIDLVLRGGTVLSSGVAQNLGEGIRQLDYVPGAYQQRRLALTDRELEMLRCRHARVACADGLSMTGRAARRGLEACTRSTYVIASFEVARPSSCRCSLGEECARSSGSEVARRGQV